MTLRDAGGPHLKEPAMTIEDAKQIAQGLIQVYIGPDHRVMDMPSFYGALVQALQASHQQGWKERGEAESSDEALGAVAG